MKKFFKLFLLASFVVFELSIPVLARVLESETEKYLEMINDGESVVYYEPSLPEYGTIDEDSDDEAKEYLEVGTYNIISVATHEELINAVQGAKAGVPLEIVVTAHFTGSSTITVNGGHQIIIRTQDSLPFVYTQTSARHFSVSGEGSSLTIENIILCGGNLGETFRGGVQVNNNAVFTMNEGSIIRNSAANHGGGVATHNGTFNFNGGSIKNNLAISQGGGVNIQNAGIFNFNGGLIDSNESVGMGAGVIAWGEGTSVNITSQQGVSTISNNRSGDGSGGLRISSSAIITIDGTLTISNNHTMTAGGGINISNATFNVNSTGTVNVQNNTAFSHGAGIAINNGNLNIDGQLNITNNTSGASGGGMSVLGSQTMLNTGHSSVTNVSNNTANVFGGGMNVTNGILVFNGHLNINNNTSVGSGGGGGGINVNFGTVTLNGSTHINGNTTTSSSGGGINVGGGSVYVNAPLYVQSNETLSNGASSFSGGGIAITHASSRLTTNPGGVLTVSGNRASASGGGIQLLLGSLTFNEHAIIENNTAGVHGGGLQLFSGNFSNYDDLTIRNNTANSAGGGINLGSLPISLSNVTITNNTANNGGGIGRTGTGALTLADNVQMSNNTARNSGGGIHLGPFNIATIIVPDTATNIRITDNHADNNGGAVYIINHNTSLTLPNNAYANLQFNAPVDFNGNTAGNGASLPPLNVTDFTNIRFSASSINGHPLNNYDIVYTPGLPLLTITTNDGTSPVSTRVAYGTHLIDAGYLTDLDRVGYQFLGWFKNEELTIPIQADMVMPRMDEFAVFAGWQAIGNVNIYLGATTAHPVNSKISNFTDINVGTRIMDLLQNFPEPSRIQHRFIGWFVNSQQTIPLNENHLVTAETTNVYAGWIEIADLIIEIGETPYFEINHELPTHQTLDVGTNIYNVMNSFVIPTKAHHNFVGWYLDADFAMPLVATSELPSGGTTVYARWERVQITFMVNIMGQYVELNASSGCTLLNVLQDIDTDVSGYIFQGWYIEVAQPFFFSFLSRMTLIPITDDMLLSEAVGYITGRWEPIPTGGNFNPTTPGSNDDNDGEDTEYNDYVLVNNDNNPDDESISDQDVNDASYADYTDERDQAGSSNNLPLTGVISQNIFIITLITFWLAVLMLYVKKWKLSMTTTHSHQV